MLLDPETLALAPGVERLLPAEGLKTSSSPASSRRTRPSARPPSRRATSSGGSAASSSSSRGARDSPSPRPDRIRSRSRKSSGSSRSRATGRWSTSSERSPRASSSAASTSTSGWRASRRASARSTGSGRGWETCSVSRANSPYLAGEETGALSSRLATLRRLPRGGPPPQLGDGGGLGGGGRGGRGRLHPNLVGRTPPPAARDARGADRRPGDVGRALRRPRRAGAGALRAPPEPGADLIAAVEPAARELGTWELVTTLRGPPEAARQLEVGRRDGLEAVAADLVRRSRP